MGYAEVAEGHKHEFRQLRAGPAVAARLPGKGSGRCLGIGCGTGAHAAVTRALRPGGVKVGATHWPLPESLERFAEAGSPLPIVLAARAVHR